MITQAPNQNISITGVMIQDPETKGYTGYFAEFPEVIAQGSSMEETKSRLFLALKDVFEFKKNEMEDEDENDDIITESFNLAIS